MKEDEAFWYMKGDFKEQFKKKAAGNSPRRNIPNKTNKPPKDEQEEENEPKYSSGSSWLQTLIWMVIIVGFIGALTWYLGGANVGLFRKKIKKVESTSHEEEIPEDIFAINYQKEIDRAAAEGNYRLAIRLMFLRLLKDMSEKNIISYKLDKTNLDYLMQLHSTVYYKDFFALTRSYEYSWYGKFNVSEENYKIIRSEFEQFERRLS